MLFFVVKSNQLPNSLRSLDPHENQKKPTTIQMRNSNNHAMPKRIEQISDSTFGLWHFDEGTGNTALANSLIAGDQALGC